MSDGRWFEPADFHRVLTTSGWHTAHQIYLFWQNLQESNLDISLSVRDEGVLNFSQIPLDYQDGCFVDHDLCGVQPLLDRDSGQVFLHHETVFSYKILFMTIWVFRHINVPVSANESTTSFPFWMTFARAGASSLSPYPILFTDF